MALNKFGQFIRKYRIDNALLLKNMAETLKIGSAYLSGMETGSKPIPSDMVEKISNAYNPCSSNPTTSISPCCPINPLFRAIIRIALAAFLICFADKGETSKPLFCIAI